MLDQKPAASASRTALARVLLGLVTAILCLAAMPRGHAQSGPLEDLAKFPRASLEILHGKKKNDPRHFEVWVADNAARQEQGLMFVNALAPGQGMLFPQEKPRKMSMWMKNTYVELDMVFIGEKGAIEQIIEHAHPLSLDKLNSSRPVSAVLELAGGEAARLGLQPGDRVSWSLL